MCIHIYIYNMYLYVSIDSIERGIRYTKIVYDFGLPVPNSWLASHRAQEINAAQATQAAPMAPIAVVSGPSTAEKQVTVESLFAMGVELGFWGFGNAARMQASLMTNDPDSDMIKDVENETR